MTGKPTVRSTMEIKQGLLRRAFDGISKYTPSEMIGMIQAASTRSRTMPEEHREALREIDPTQPRGVMMLNLLAKEAGIAQRYTDASLTDSGKVMPPPLTLQ